MPKSKGDKPKTPGPSPTATTTVTGQQDAELKAQQKAEKAKRKAEYEATRAVQVAAEKAERDKLKSKKQPSSSASSDVKTDNNSASSKSVSVAKPKEKLTKKSSSSSIAAGGGHEEGKKGSTVVSPSLSSVTATMKVLKIKDSDTQPGSTTTPLATTTTGGPLKATLPKRVPTTSQSRVQTLFDHLPKGVDPRRLFEEPSGIKIKGIDSVFIALGLMYSHGQLHGSNNRVIALINVVRSFIDSYTTPAEKDFKYEFSLSLTQNVEFLRKCRPFAVAMNNTVDFINGKVRDIKVEDGKSENEIKKELSEALQEFREERIDKATEAIVAKAKGKIVTDDVVLVFGSSDLVREVIVKASSKTSFSIVVVDGRPYATERRAKGLDILTRIDHKLIRHVKYTSITGLSNVIRSVTKVILGAHGLLTNGGVLAHAGTSQIALMASANNIPVLVCCETLKFCDKSPTDSFFLNEIGTGFGLSKKITESIAAECEPYLVAPVIKYDVTPPELVTAVITDVDILPCTSVPVVLRVQENRTTIKLHTPAATRVH